MVDAPVLIRDFLLLQSSVVDLLGTNINASIYASYDLPEHFDPKKGPCIQIFWTGGRSHPEILPLVNARLQVRVWADDEQSDVAMQVYAALQDVLHGTTNVQLDDGYLMSALEVTGPEEMTDPNTGWVAVNSYYAVMARPN